MRVYPVRWLFVLLLLTSVAFAVNPTVTSTSPSSGPVGTQVQILGSGFGSSQGTSSVVLGGSSPSIVNWSDTVITVTVPAAATTGYVSVTVGGVTSNASVYFNVPGPQITGISPTSGIVSTSVTVTGTGFQSTKPSGATIAFNGSSGTIVTWSDTQIVATVPPGATTGPVAVTVNGVSSNQDFLFSMPRPVVSGLLPFSGEAGSSVQINGTGFGASQGTNKVQFAGTNATVTAWSDTQITATVPVVTSPASVRVSVGGVLSPDAIDFTIPAPQVNSVTPTAGIGGTAITVTGSGFQTTKGSSTLSINGTTAATTTWTDTQITANVPSSPATGPVKVTVNGVSSNANVLFTVPNPIIASISPTSGPAGATVQITGTGFGATQGSSTLQFNGFSATPTSWSDTQITTTVPPAATSGRVLITVSGINSPNNTNFTVNSPVITSISPSSGGVGTTVTITGTGFRASRTQGQTNGSTSTVYFNGTSASSMPTWSDTQITAVVPSGITTGPVTIGGLAGTSNVDVVFTLPNPIVTSLSPSSGSPGTPGTTVQINGSGFGTTQGTVKFNSGNTANIVSWSDTQIVVTVPAAASPGPVTVIVGGITSNSNINFFIAPPQITSISPTSGGTNTPVTINGTGFGGSKGSSTVSLSSGTNLTVGTWNDTQIVATVPSGATTGSIQVNVAATGLQSNNDLIFTLPSPAISAITPSGAPVGAQVQINGHGFGATQGTSTILIGSLSMPVGSWSDTSIAATIPTGATSGSLQIAVGGVSTSGSLQVSNLNLNAISPVAGPVNTAVTISGTGFGGTQGGTSTLFYRGVSITPTTWSDTQITANVPTGAVSGFFSVKVGSTTVSALQQFTVANVVVSGVSPASAIVGTSVQVTGSGFGTTQGTSSIVIGGLTATVVDWSDTQIHAKVPSGTSNSQLYVNAPGGQSNVATFTVLKPVITSISPSSGAAGTPVTVTGSNFGSTQGTTSGFSFTGGGSGGNATVTNWTDTSITATVPGNAHSGSIYTTLNGGISSNTNINFTVPTPVITSISPTNGVVGATVTINGSGFVSQSGTVYFNGTPATFTTWTDTQIVAIVPAGSKTGPVRVAATSGVNSNTDQVFSMPNPVITSLVPATGPLDTVVQINGSGFGATQGSSTLAFANTPATPLTWSDTLITAKVPATAVSGAIKVSVGGVPTASTIDFNIPPPQITSVSPSRGTAGTTITVTGSGFYGTRGNGTLSLGSSQPFSIVTWTDTQIVATVLSSAATGGLQVWQNIPSNSDIKFTVISPFITGVSPANGSVSTQVQINGSGFGTTQGSSTVSFNGQTASIVSWADAQIVATVPAKASSGNITVTVAGVQSNSNINFAVPTPKITGLSPSSGVVGSSITVNGSGFQSSQGTGSVVLTSGATAAVTSWSDTQIVFQVPPAAVSGTVKVLANNGDQSNLDFSLALPNPAVAGVVPSSGAGNTQVQINGTGFGATQGSNTVSFGTTYATVVSWSDTQIVALVPSTIGSSAPITVKEGGVSSNSNVYFNILSPVISSLSPNIGGGGNSVTIYGTGFESTQGANSKVSFSGIPATIKSWSDTQIVATVPPTVVTGSVAVIANNIPSNYVIYTVPNNAVSALSPSTGPVGTQVTVSGTGFGASQGTSALTFNGQTAASIVSWSNTQIVATVPVTATSGPAVVAVNNIKSNATITFSVPHPSLGTVSPMGGIAGTTVTINGSNFQTNQRDSTVTFNGVPATVSSWSDSQIVASVPSGASTGPIKVTVNSFSNDSGGSFEVPSPVISGITPPQAPAGGTITITGSGFGPNQTVSPDGVSITYVGSVQLNGTPVGVSSWSDTSITAVLPANASNGSLNVSKFDATSNSLPITIEGAPTIATLTPSSAGVSSTVVIDGSNFGPSQYSSTVQFSGVTANVASWSDTQITVTVPPGAYTGPALVTIAGVNSNTLPFILTTSAQVTDSLGNSSSFTSSMLGGGWHASFSLGSGCSTCSIRGVRNMEHDSVGRVLSNSDDLQRKTFFTYDSNDNIASSTIYLDANTPVTTAYTYNSFGEPLTATDPLGNVITNTYDANGNLLTVTSPTPNGTTAASVTQFAYDTKGELTQITDPLGHITTLSYYPTGLIHTITDAQSNVTSYEYDSRGNRTAVVDAQQNRTTFAYDLVGQLTSITYPDSTSVSFTYDSRGRKISVTDQNENVTSYGYDDADRLTSVTDAANHMTGYAYDTEDNLLSITDANNHATSFTYDAFGRVTQATFPSNLTERYVYDAVGNLTSKTDRKNETIQYVYDTLDRLSHKGYPDSTSVDYVYDLVGQIKQVTDPTGTYGFAYDNMGRLVGTTTQYQFLPGNTYTNSYGYDAASNRTSFTAPDGSTNTYAYDTMGRISTLTNSMTGQFGFSYDNLSRRTQITRPNGVNTNYSYDSLSHLLNILHHAGTTTIDGASYLYDNTGNRTSKTNYLNNVTEQYTYDPLYQLTQVTQGATTTESYSYDAVGNRLSSLGMSPYAYNSSNELTSKPSATFTYDANGNTLSKTNASGTTQYGWDFENRLSSAVVPGIGTVTFRYDPFGRRIQKSGASGTTNYLYDGANAIEEVDAAGNLLGRYTQGVGIDEPLAELRSGTSAFYEEDGLGSTTSLSSSTGTISNSYTYDAFGNGTLNGSFVNPYRFTARDYDSETGLQYSRARYYDPTVGRFLSEDPSDFDGGINFYAYVGNDPVNWFDPFGLDRMGYGDIANLVAQNNKSGQSNELIICMAFKESSFDPDASLPGSQSAHGLLGVTDSAATQVGVPWENTATPAANIAAGSAYLAWRIHLNHGNVRNGLWGYGTGRAYADSLLNCEKCLLTHDTSGKYFQCKTMDCLWPLHPAPPKPKRHHGPRPRRPRKPKS